MVAKWGLVCGSTRVSWFSLLSSLSEQAHPYDHLSLFLFLSFVVLLYNIILVLIRK